jgi:predicted MFS family arabinose efflux permease
MTTARWAPAVSFLTTLLSLSYAPAVAKALPLMFSGEKLNEANALNGAAFLIASAIGPALGGAVLARCGLRAGCAAFALLSLANAPLAFAHMLPRPSAAAGAPRPSRRLLELMKALAASPAVLALALMGVLLNFCLAPINVALAPMMLSFGAGPDGYGFAMSVFVAGALAGNVLVGSRLTRGVAWDRSIFASLGAMAIGLASVGLSGSAAQATASMALLGALVPFFQVPMSTYLQRTIPPEDAGQAFASLNAATTASAPLAAAGAGLLLRTMSPAALFHCAGGACALLCLGWAISRRQAASARVYDAA